MILAGDIGGTKVLLQLSEADGESASGARVRFERRYASSGHAGLAEMLRDFLDRFAAESGGAARIARACLGIAGPVTGRQVKVTNLPWVVDADQLAVAFDIPAIKLVNDFEAAANWIDFLQDDGRVTLQAGIRDPSGHRVILGAGTGLGVAYSIRAGDAWQVVPGEGGHLGFAPVNGDLALFCEELRSAQGRVIAEHVVSGPGLARLGDFVLRHASGVASGLTQGASPEAIVALAGADDELANRALHLFAAAYGSVAGDHALAILAHGGVYLCGGLSPLVLPPSRREAFLAGFHDKGPHARLMHDIPVHVVTDPAMGLNGARAVAMRLAAC